MESSLCRNSAQHDFTCFCLSFWNPISLCSLSCFWHHCVVQADLNVWFWWLYLQSARIIGHVSPTLSFQCFLLLKKKIKKILFIFMWAFYLYGCVCIDVYLVPVGGQKRAPVSLKLELQVILSPIYVLGNEPESSAGVASALNCWLSAPAPLLCIFNLTFVAVGWHKLFTGFQHSTLDSFHTSTEPTLHGHNLFSVVNQ